MKNKIIIPSKKIYLKHLSKYTQYSNSKNWLKWYSRIAPLKGIRVAKTLLKYKENNAKVLDLGCGTGLTLAIVSQNFPNSIGCEISEMEIKATKEILKQVKVNIPVVKYDGKKLPFKDNSFDIVTSIEVIEHVEKPELMLKEINRVLRKKGILHITTANKLWPIEPHYKLLFLSYLPAFLADYYVRLTRRGEIYHDIKLPTYNQFYKMVSRYFKVENITLEAIKNFNESGLGKERGAKVIFIGKILNILDLSQKRFRLLKPIGDFIYVVVMNISLGWLLIGHSKK